MCRTGIWSTALRIALVTALPLYGSSPESARSEEPLTLPLSKVVLYSSGVGYFQHDGTIMDTAPLNLRFNVNQINDILKSFVAQDFGGGQVSSVTYGSRDPITKSLSSFAVNLNGNPSLAHILTQLRGEALELSAPNPISGTLLSIEKKTEAFGDGPQRRLIEQEYVNLLAEDGFRSIPLTQIQRIKLANASLNHELSQALAVLATNHDTQKKTVSVLFAGKGARKARVAYLSETPVWKTSYRLVLEDEKAPYLQGWAIVENQTEQDWTNVRLSLVSGRPISFRMELYQPLYYPRPLVESELHASLRPQLYGEALEDSKPAETMSESKDEGYERVRRNRANAPLAKQSGQVPSTLAASVLGGKEQTFSIQEGIPAQAVAQQTGELFEYRLSSPVTLARNSSALLSIISQEVAGRKVSIYNQTVNEKHPLHGYRLKNDSPLYLMQGPLTMFDGGAYAGEARIDSIAPGQDRLLSYALDLTTEVESRLEGGTQDLVSVAVKKGTLLVTHRLVEDRTFLIKNRDQKSRTVLIETPYRADWKLLEPQEPAERTRDVYRFSLTVEGGKSATLRVKENLPTHQSIHLIDSGLEQISYYLRAREVSGTVKEALQRVATLRVKLDETRAQRARQEHRIADITAEHGRIRENMQRLAQNSDLYNRYVKKLDQQETELEKLRKDIENLKNAEEDQRRDLQQYLMNLDVA